MKIKLDENIPVDVAGPLAKLEHDVDTVQHENLAGEPDSTVWDAAQKEGRFLITQDHYFTDIRNHPPNTHAGVLLLRLHQTGRGHVINRVKKIFETIDVSDWPGCIVVANEKHVRVRKS